MICAGNLTGKTAKTVETELKLEIWGKAQRESIWRHKSYWGKNLCCWISHLSNL